MLYLDLVGEEYGRSLRSYNAVMVAKVCCQYGPGADS